MMHRRKPVSLPLLAACCAFGAFAGPLIALVLF